MNHAGADGQMDVATSYCMEPCKHGRRDAADMVRCCICYNWFHEDCLDRDCAPSHDATWWLCSCCRQMPQTIATLTTSINRLCGLVETLSTENKTLKDEISALKNSNDVILAQIQPLKDIDLRSRGANDINGQNKLPRLLIGDSTIRDVLSNDDTTLCVNSKGGAKTGDILSMLNKYMPGSNSDVLIHVGTNDSSTKFPNDKIVENMSRIMDTAKEKSVNGRVIISDICPRTDNSDAASIGTAVNEALKTLANEKDCVFIDHTDSFLTRCGEIIEYFLLIDGMHLSAAGTRKLLKNLNISQYATGKLDMPRTTPA